MQRWPIVLGLTLLSSIAWAVEQPDGTPIPTEPGCDAGLPTGLASVFSCVCDQPNVCNIGDPCPSATSCDDGQRATCETTMWHVFNDNTCIPSQMSGLDARQDAKVTPETFRPTCPLTFTVLSRGTALFRDIFGWYNATGSQPDVSDLHPMIACGDLPGTSVVLDIQNDPAYAGGEIGFFLASPESHTQGGQCANGDCCSTLARLANDEGHVYFSERAFNPDFQGSNSVIHLLIYDSKVWPQKFYFAWEDIFGGSNNDFTDLVTGVEGVECSGGGVTCDTSLPGACHHGVAECSDDGVLGCTQLYQSEPEECDAVDNDCNGQVDDGAVCPDNRVCHNGRCIGSCKSGEFPCQATGTVCDEGTGLCVAEDCIGKQCGSDQVCRNGECVGPCEGIVCPRGQTCVSDNCIDLCDGVSCDSGQVCRAGLCFDGCAQCSGAACDDPLRCDTVSGECLDPSCPQGCPPNTFCENGTCKDNCEGAVCPGGAPCANGQCEASGTGGSAGDGGSPLIDGGAGGMGTGGAGGATNPDAGEPTGAEFGKPKSGCGCRMAGGTQTSALALLGLAGLTAWGWRRRNGSGRRGKSLSD